MSVCKYAGKGNARTIPGRHAPDCPEVGCPGCQPCEEAHCRICRHAHVDGTCPECMAETREWLHGIARMCGALPEEVEHRGVDGEAMMLLGPVADFEARGHVEASAMVGRVTLYGDDGKPIADVRHYLTPSCEDTHCRNHYRSELHPLAVLGSWESVWRDALDHDAPDELLTLSAAVDYLDTQMTYMGGYPHVPFEDFARDLRSCGNHLEAVLHDGEQRETGAPCMTCHKPLERTWGDDEKGDGWKCHRCQQTSTDTQYRFAVMHLHRESAEWLTDRDMQIRTGVKAGTVRSWAREQASGETLVRKRRDAERTVYAVEDVMKAAKAKGLVA